MMLVAGSKVEKMSIIIARFRVALLFALKAKSLFNLKSYFCCISAFHLIVMRGLIRK
jgi:hypothetical protein